MPLLIDGHNLIGQMPAIGLDDPQKEARLTLLLRQYLSKGKRRATVVFDRGLPGGNNRGLGNRSLTVVFAPQHSDADTLLINRINKTREPRGLIVISDDQRVLHAAHARGCPTRSSRHFAAELTRGPVIDDEKRERGLNADEVDEWLDLFGGASKDLF